MDDDGCYDPATGIFTAKTPGKYMFSWTVILTDDSAAFETMLMKNGTPISASRNYDYNHGDQTTNRVIVHLVEGDEVFVMLDSFLYSNDIFSDINVGLSSFSGFKLH